MNYWTSFLSVGFSILLVACSIETASTEGKTPQPINPKNPVQETLGQQLPITAEAIVAGQTIQLEVARTQQQQATGLMYRTTLENNRGMLFPFQPPLRVSFWMKNVAIPLDMIFLHRGKVKAIAANVPPCTKEPCRTYGPAVLIDQVIELRGGRAAELGIRVGDSIVIKPLQPM